MSVQHTWNLSQPLGYLLAVNLKIYLETLSLVKSANNVPKLPSIDYVVKNWALAMMLKALSLVHFWNVLLLKEQMMTSFRKTLKMLVWLGQNRSICDKIFPKITPKLAFFTNWFSAKFASKIAVKLADLYVNLHLKILWNLTFFRRPIRSSAQYGAIHQTHQIWKYHG